MTNPLSEPDYEGLGKTESTFGDNARELDAREIRGLVLDPTEAVKFDPRVDPRSRNTSDWPIKGGGHIVGSKVAELVLGSDKTFTAISLIEVGTRMAHGKEAPIVVLVGKQDDEDRFVIFGELDAGREADNFEPLELGRAMDDEAVANRFVNTVSGTHCSVGVTADGYVGIVNSDPTNSTVLKLT